MFMLEAQSLFDSCICSNLQAGMMHGREMVLCWDYEKGNQFFQALVIPWTICVSWNPREGKMEEGP